MLFNATGAYVLAVGLASVFVLILLLQKQRGGKEVSLWLFSGLVGALLSAAVVMAVATYLGFELQRSLTRPDLASEPMEMIGDPGTMGGMSGGPGGGGGQRTIPPKRQLTTLVRKLELLTGEIALTLSQDQAAAICVILADAVAAETMTDEEAQGEYDALLGVLNEDQTAKQEKIRLARPPRGGGRGFGGMGEGEDEEDENANPFKETLNAEAVAALSQRLGGKKEPVAKDSQEEKADP